MNAQHLSLDCSDEVPTSDHDHPQNVTEPFVGQSRESLEKLSDEELQSYIVACAEQCNAAHARYKLTGNFADAGDRDRFWTAEAQALVEMGVRRGAC